MTTDGVSFNPATTQTTNDVTRIAKRVENTGNKELSELLAKADEATNTNHVETSAFKEMIEGILTEPIKKPAKSPEQKDSNINNDEIIDKMLKEPFIKQLQNFQTSPTTFYGNNHKPYTNDELVDILTKAKE